MDLKFEGGHLKGEIEEREGKGDSKIIKEGNGRKGKEWEEEKEKEKGREEGKGREPRRLLRRKIMTPTRRTMRTIPTTKTAMRAVGSRFTEKFGVIVMTLTPAARSAPMLYWKRIKTEGIKR